MLVYLHGGEFRNKGAELMLRTTAQELRERITGVRLAAQPTCGSYDRRAELQLWQLIRAGRFSLVDAAFGKVLHSPLGRKLVDIGAVHTSDLDALIDISGFAYGDQWPTSRIEATARIARDCHRRGKPVILLPQALGPFERKEIRDEFRKMLDHVTLICPRDRVSESYVRDLAPKPEAIFPAPDITLFSGCHAAGPSARMRRACIVPNVKMLAKAGDLWGDRYESLLLDMSRSLLGRGFQVAIIVHDTSGGDVELAKSMQSALGDSSVELVQVADPFAIKRYIHESALLIGSRFHSIASALSTGTPVMALGWSHKYEMLLEDFECSRYLIAHDTPSDDVSALLNELTDADTNNEVGKRIADRLSAQSALNQAMWGKVEGLLTRGGPNQ
jgi:polysaccharide pyruvyl transferase WcaK-like protein